MKIQALALLAFTASAAAFAPTSSTFGVRSPSSLSESSLTEAFDLGDVEAGVRRLLSLVSLIVRDVRTFLMIVCFLSLSCSSQNYATQLKYKAVNADTEFARRFGHLAGAEIKTVGEAFTEFTEELGVTVNALYKNMITDIVGTTHLIAVNARFTRDPVWSLGILTSLDLLLKNYPEPETGGKIISALFKCCLLYTSPSPRD